MKLELNKAVKTVALTASLLTLGNAANAGGQVEVLHWWTSGGEAKAAGELKKSVNKAGHEWKDFAVSGGGGENAMTVLKSRAVSGKPPAAAQIKGPEIQNWADLGFLADLTPVAKANNWDKQLPNIVANIMKYEGKYVAVPVNVHRVNWLWANKAIFDKVGVKPPKTWDEFLVTAEKIKKAGYIALAHGGQPWQDATLFEAIALGVGGTDFYQKALVKADPKAINSDTMVKVLEMLKKVSAYMDKGQAGREWNLATSMVIKGQGAMQIMGDWAKGEFSAAGKTPGKDYLCVPAPGTYDDFTFNIDSMAMFKLKNKDNQKAQADLARLILEPEFQTVFNLNKGSIPVRTDIAMDKFDDCAKRSMKEFKATAKTGGLVPSFAHGMALQSSVQGAIVDNVTNFLNSKKMSAKQAAEKMAKAVKNAI